ncbi:MAG: hypothetical protein WCC90_15155 [Methylocella sp.]
MHGDRGQSAEIINRVVIDVVVAIGSLMVPPLIVTPVPFPMTTECATRRMAIASTASPVPLLLATTLRSMTTRPGPPLASTPLPELFEATLSTTVTLSDAAVVTPMSTMIPSILLLFAVTLLRTPATTAVGRAGSDGDGVARVNAHFIVRRIIKDGFEPARGTSIRKAKKSGGFFLLSARRSSARK